MQTEVKPARGLKDLFDGKQIGSLVHRKLISLQRQFAKPTRLRRMPFHRGGAEDAEKGIFNHG
jgi:hypothetical protein